MDVATCKRSYIEKARIYVEMDMGEPLPEKSFVERENPNIGSYWETLKYARFHYCAHYSPVGHTTDHCKKRIPKEFQGQTRKMNFSQPKRQ